MPADLLSINDLEDTDIRTLLDWADDYRSGNGHGRPLEGRSVALLFEKPSLRTKLSFDIGIHELGGHPIYMSKDEVGLDVREPVEDVAGVIERWVAAVVARVNDHSALERFAGSMKVPVINALSDVEHPCQALADLQTIRQKLGRLEDVKVAFVGDGNNCALSLALATTAMGGQFTIACPDPYSFDRETTECIAARGMRPLLTEDPHEAVENADVIYTDVWTSMGQEEETKRRRKAFRGYQVNPDLVSRAKPGAIVMHPMPVHYGEEMPPGMLQHPQSVAFDQAENRLHAQKAVLRLLTAGE
jgi:ornithine carbamoyltransferase